MNKIKIILKFLINRGVFMDITRLEQLDSRIEALLNRAQDLRQHNEHLTAALAAAQRNSEEANARAEALEIEKAAVVTMIDTILAKLE